MEEEEDEAAGSDILVESDHPSDDGVKERDQVDRHIAALQTQVKQSKRVAERVAEGVAG